MKDVRHLGHMVVCPEYTSGKIKLIGVELFNFWVNKDGLYYSKDVNEKVFALCVASNDINILKKRIEVVINRNRINNVSYERIR